jgi:hypothetical protein
MKTLRVWFYDPAADSEGFVNKLVSRLDSPFCHVEVQLSDDRSCSIYMGSKVLLRPRTFDSPNYSCLHVPCSDVQHTLATGHAEHMYSQGLTFSSLQMTSCFLWSPASSSPYHTFCSKLVTEILQQAGVLGTNIDAQKTSPSALHRLLEPLSQQKRVVVKIPAAQRTMALDFKLPTT